MIIFNSKKFLKIVLVVSVILVLTGCFLYFYYKAPLTRLGHALNSFINKEYHSEEETNNEVVLDVSQYANVMPVETGTKWIYEGKRIFFDVNQDKTMEVIAKKTVEITSTEKDGDNLRVFIKTSYQNEPDFEEGEDSFLLSEFGYAFYGTNLSYFPLASGQRLSPPDSDPERTDNYYVDYVYSVSIKNVLGKRSRCYDIVYDTLADESLEVFCEGVGYIRDSYKHHGTPDEWDYKLIRIEHPEIS